MEQSNTSSIVADIHSEPDLLDYQACSFRKTMAFDGHASDDFIDDLFAKEDHTKPAETRNESDAYFDFDTFACGWVADAEVLVAFEEEGLGRLSGLA